MELKPLKVSEVNQYIKRLLVSDPILYNLNVEGEISNFNHHYNGHMYFTLKDENSKIRCVMFSGDNRNLDFIPKDGMKVTVSGYISVYERDGSYQLYAKKLKRMGLGDLFAAFEKLKKKLEKEGFFNPIHKKKLPYIPKKIGVVTSSTGAAIRDIITVIKRRFPYVEIIIYPVLVQGERAPRQICKGLNYFNSRKDIDLVITGRGGGSIEELWAFNDEDVARSIFDMNVPIISAVGHETDFTISDFVSDLRAPTPSAAGELATPIYDELNSKLKDNLLRLELTLRSYLNNKKNILDIHSNNLRAFSPIHKVNENEDKLEMLAKNLVRSIRLQHENSKNKLHNLIGRLNALSPLATLNRGYSIAVNKEKKLLKSVEGIKENDVIQILMSDGKVTSKVTSIDKGEEWKGEY